MAEDNNNNGNNAINLVPEVNRALRDYVVPLLLRLFPFSLRDKTKSWLNSLSNGSITTWEDLAQKFLTKFFLPVKSVKMRNDITSFTQFDVRTIKTTIDVAAGGALMSKNATDAYNMLEKMASNNYQWPSERLGSRKAARAYEIDAIGNLAVQVATLSKKFDTLGVHAVKNSFVVCEMCGDSHSSDQCSYNSTSLQFVGNFNRNHPNFSWNNNAGPFNLNPIMPPSFQQQARPPILEKKSQVEELLLQYMSKTDALIQSYGASLRNLETKVGQLVNSFNNRPQGALLSDTQVNPKGKEHCNAITLRIGKEVEGVSRKSIESSKQHVHDDKAIVEKEIKVEKTDNGQAKNQGDSQAIYPPPPFPQRLKRQKLDKQFENFLNVFKKLHINILFAEPLENMPSYVKFLKDILTKKRKLEDFETVALIEEFKFAKALCDLGASVSIMPLSIAKKIRLKEIQPTTVSLQLANRTIRYPVGIIEDVLVKVGHLYIPMDFIMLKMKEELEIPLILG
ncbi:PREDICTED: uncharacterized protein LOC108661374 [Theobroma cacao]|uniref:Uncharacterized protein LOC108661374 n=1 Tax=Theobroma cacao TaxID=3641 RepID=A0AB32W3I2_THECC|nr:PREDICTED: uncharacterized protein LOC108661374 [Theobroma cacao]